MATAAMTEEEKADIEKAMNPNSPASTPGITEHARPTTPPPAAKAAGGTSPPRGAVPHTPPPPASAAASANGKSPLGLTPSSSSPALSESQSTLKDAKGKRKLTPEQREKLEVIEKQRIADMKARVDELSTKLIERLRPYVDATATDEISTWEAKVKKEAEDLKLESFGVEVIRILLEDLHCG